MLVQTSFFKATKQQSCTSTITSLVNESGKIHLDQASIKTICSKFYLSFYIIALLKSTVAASPVNVLDNIIDYLSKTMKVDLQALILIRKLNCEVQDMTFGKAPSLDNIIIEFYRISIMK